jgi:hypothetical protein
MGERREENAAHSRRAQRGRMYRGGDQYYPNLALAVMTMPMMTPNSPARKKEAEAWLGWPTTRSTSIGGGGRAHTEGRAEDFDDENLYEQ